MSQNISQTELKDRSALKTVPRLFNELYEAMELAAMKGFRSPKEVYMALLEWNLLAKVENVPSGAEALICEVLLLFPSVRPLFGDVEPPSAADAAAAHLPALSSIDVDDVDESATVPSDRT